MSTTEQPSNGAWTKIPWFGARKVARKLLAERDAARQQLDRISSMGRELVAQVKQLRAQREIALKQFKDIGALDHLQLELRKQQLESEIAEQSERLERERAAAEAAVATAREQVREAHKSIVMTDEVALLQEVGIYQYRHPLTEVVAYETALANIQGTMKAMVKKDGGAVLATTDWAVNGSAKEGRAMVRDFSKLMLRAFNAEADSLVRNLKPYKLDSALDRLKKVAETIERLGRTMKIQISPPYLELRWHELELTADYLQKEAEEKEVQRQERERAKEDRKVQQEIQRERARLQKERQHYANALAALVAKGDQEGAARLREQLTEVEEEIESVDFRAANVRAGYVYVISNIGSFGDRVVKIGMTRRLEPMDRIRELGDASVPFIFDIHALHFSNDAVGIESELHRRLADRRVNMINQRREFFYATPSEVKTMLGELAGELLQFKEASDALEYHQGLQARQRSPAAAPTAPTGREVPSLRRTVNAV